MTAWTIISTASSTRTTGSITTRRRSTRAPPHQSLFDILRPLRHVNYVTGAGTSPYSMIDEKRNDRIDNNLNWNIKYDDVGIDGLDDGAFGAHDGLPTSGYDTNFHDTGLPGEPHIDKTDVKESDQIGLTNFSYFTPSSGIIMGDKESLWQRLIPGYFDVPLSIVGGRPQSGEDGDFRLRVRVFSPSAENDRTVLARACLRRRHSRKRKPRRRPRRPAETQGDCSEDLRRELPVPAAPRQADADRGAGGSQSHALLGQEIRKPRSIPVLLTKNFEGYRLYKSTDPNFSDIFTITDGSGSPQGYKWMQEWDLRTVSPATSRPRRAAYQDASGFTYFLGNDNGLVHSFVDSTRRQRAAVLLCACAYSKGDAPSGIFPAENTHFVTITPFGEVVHDQNVAVVVPNAKSAGYVAAATGVPLTHVAQKGAGAISYVLADQTKLTGHRYQVQFFDTQVDSVTPAGIPVGSPDSSTWGRITTSYSVLDLNTFTEQFVSHDTLISTIGRKNFLPSSVVVRNRRVPSISPSAYILNPAVGSIKGSAYNSLPAGTIRSPTSTIPCTGAPISSGSPSPSRRRTRTSLTACSFRSGTTGARTRSTASSGWIGTPAYVWSLSPENCRPSASGYRKPGDYEFQFSTSPLTHRSISPGVPTLAIPGQPALFQGLQPDRQHVREVLLLTTSPGRAGKTCTPMSQVIFIENNPRGVVSPTWSAYFTVYVSNIDTMYNLRANDKLVIKTSQPFRYGDIFEFTPDRRDGERPRGKDRPYRVKVVPIPM